MTIEAFMITCVARESVLADTIRSLEASWSHGSPRLIWDPSTPDTPKLVRIYANWSRMLHHGGNSQADFVLLLEDDLMFPADFGSRLDALAASHRGDAQVAISLYQPDGKPGFLGGQAWLMRPITCRYILAQEASEVSLHWDIKLPRIAARACHVEQVGLVQHVGVSTWGGPEHHAVAP